MFILKIEISDSFQIQLYGICMLIMSKHTSLDRNQLKLLFPCVQLTEQYFQLIKTTFEGLIDSGVVGMEIFRLEREGVLEYNFHFENKEKALMFKMRGLVNEPTRIL